MSDAKPLPTGVEPKWYEGITRYQWLVLVIASLGWVFDVFEGQIFVASMNEAFGALLPPDTSAGDRTLFTNISFASFLLGGALGGVVFGSLSDRIGRTKTMIYTILVYSLFTCFTAFAQNWWQMAIMRFLVAMGVGGEWAVASAMVAEVFPARARARTSSIFHGSSVLGSYMAAIAGIYVVGNSALGEHGWRWGFAIGALPALLTIWIRVKLREPDSWVAARDRANKDESKRAGRISELFSGPHIRGTMIGLTLSTVGLATFWGVHIYGKNFLQRATERSILQENAEELTNLTAELTAAGRGAEAGSEAKKTVLQRRSRESKVGEMLGMIVTTTGGGIGLFAFGPICEWIGRRGAFFFYHIGAFIASLVLFYVFPASSVGVYCWTLPVFGFFTLGMHAGYAVYFPELYPTRLRGTGGGFCFNVGRISAAGVILLVGLMSSDTALNRLGLSAWALSERGAATALTCMFLLGAFIVLAAPETKGRELPE